MKNKTRISAILLILTLAFTICVPTTALAASKKAVKITPAKNISVVTVGSKTKIKPTTSVKCKKITYKVSNTKLAVVKSGKLVAKKTGTVKVKITVTPKSNKYKTTSKTVKIKIVKKHSHNWKPVYGTKTVTKPAWDEKVYVRTVIRCLQCEYTTSDQIAMDIHSVDEGHNYTAEDIYETVHHKATTTTEKYIKYYKCSKCGATK